MLKGKEVGREDRETLRIKRIESSILNMYLRLTTGSCKESCKESNGMNESGLRKGDLELGTLSI